MKDPRLFARPTAGARTTVSRWALVLLAAGLWYVPLLAHTDALAPQSPQAAPPGAGRAAAVGFAPVPRALLHADGDGDRIFDDLETRLERADPAAAVPALVMFDLPLGQVDLAAARRQVGEFAVTASFPRERAIGARLTPAQVRALAALPHVAHIEGDDWLTVARETAVPSFGVTKARDDFKLTGDGDGAPDSYSPADNTIAVIDTGIDGGHADFAGDKIIEWVDFVNGRRTPYDDMGHGTHVASIAAGRIRDGVGGVAPGAALVGVKVMDKNGNAHTSDVVRGLEWCLNNQDDLGIRVINLSLSGNGDGDGTDVMSQAIHECVDAGIVVCVAAGNQGPAGYTIPAPGAAPDAITVGTMIDPGKGGFALWKTSGRGPTADGRIKPDLVAPGYKISAAKAGTVTGNTIETGSSMATPFVAGVCALMLAANPDMTPAEVKEILKKTAVDFGPPGEDVDYGAGRLDAYAAIRAAAAPAGAESGSGPPVPDHRFLSGSLDTGGYDTWTIQVADTRNPIGVALVVPGWTQSDPSRYQLQLCDPNGMIMANAVADQREQLITFQPQVAGTYTLRVDAATGQGPYFVDVSYDAVEGQAQGARR